MDLSANQPKAVGQFRFPTYHPSSYPALPCSASHVRANTRHAHTPTRTQYTHIVHPRNITQMHKHTTTRPALPPPALFPVCVAYMAERIAT